MKTPRTFTTRLRVRYAETDQMGVVYHANYLVWFEVGRVELLREMGFTYQQMEAEEGCVMPVAEVRCRYRAPARYDDLLELETRLIAIRGPVLKFAYKLRRPKTDSSTDPDTAPNAYSNGAPALLLAEAVTTHVVVDRSLKMRPLPEAYAAAMRAILA
jgi:acyl-CoA thioester hydrolase